jgi:hypothetical protein
MKVGPFVLLSNILALDRPAELDVWERHAKDILSIHRNSAWWVGDLVNYGLANFGDEFWQCIDEGTVSLRQLESCMYVARAYPPEDRVPGLSFTHHSIAARLAPGLRRAVLQQALRNGWDTRALSKHIRELNQGATPTESFAQEGDFAGSVE